MENRMHVATLSNFPIPRCHVEFTAMMKLSFPGWVRNEVRLLTRRGRAGHRKGKPPYEHKVLANVLRLVLCIANEFWV